MHCHTASVELAATVGALNATVDRCLERSSTINYIHRLCLPVRTADTSYIRHEYEYKYDTANVRSKDDK